MTALSHAHCLRHHAASIEGGDANTGTGIAAVNKSPSFPTITLVLGGMNLEVPAHWSTDRTGNACWWAGDIDETIAIYVQVAYLDVWEKADTAHSNPTVNTEAYVAQTVESLRTIPLFGEIEIDRVQSGYVVHAVTDDEEDGKRRRSHRWYWITGRSDYVTCVRLDLVFRPETADDAAVAWLFEHLGSKAREMDVFARVVDGPNALSLKDLSVDDLFGIRIPDDWAYDAGEHSGFRTFRCYPRDSQLGKLLITYDYARLKDEYADGRDPEITNKLADLRDDGFVENDERRRLSRARFAGPLGVILRLIDDEKPRPYAEDEIDRLYVRHHQWFYVLASRRNSLVAFFNMSIPLRWINRPEAAETIALMEREIKAMRLLHAFDR
jgi:hypothetical protein